MQEAAAELKELDEEAEQMFGGETVDGEDDSASQVAEDHEGEAHEEAGSGGGCEEATNGEAQEREIGSEEVRQPQVASQPYLPSKDERDVHDAMGHAQFRSWCEPCVEGQGREDRHFRGPKEEAAASDQLRLWISH